MAEINWTAEAEQWLKVIGTGQVIFPEELEYPTFVKRL